MIVIAFTFIITIVIVIAVIVEFSFLIVCFCMNLLNIYKRRFDFLDGSLGCFNCRHGFEN